MVNTAPMCSIHVFLLTLLTKLTHIWTCFYQSRLVYPLHSTLSKCCHAVVALLYPFVWQHTYIPVLPSDMLDIVCTPTPFFVGLLSSSLPQLTELPLEEVRNILHTQHLNKTGYFMALYLQRFWLWILEAAGFLDR